MLIIRDRMNTITVKPTITLCAASSSMARFYIRRFVGSAVELGK
jgi:hypothetical protein